MAMKWLHKVFQHIISCGEEDAPIRYYTRDDNIASFPNSPLLQSTTPTVVTSPTVVHSFPAPDRPPSIVPWSNALANKSINTPQSKPSPSVGQSTRPPPIAQLSPALATTNIPSKASPSPGLSKRPSPPIAHSSSTTTHSSLLQSATPTTATPPIAIHSSPVSLSLSRLPSIVPSYSTLDNNSSSTVSSKPSPSVGQSMRPSVAQLSPAALATTNILSKASPSPVLSKRPSQPIAHSSSSSTTTLQSRATLDNNSSSTVSSKPSPSVGQSTRPSVAQLSPAALATTNILSKASPSPVLSKRPSQPIAHSSSSSTTTLQSRATTSRAPTLEAYIRKSPDSLVTEQKELAREEGRASTTLPPKLGNLDTHTKHLKSFLQRYEIPKHLKELIERDKVPPVLLGAVSLATYEDYFACLLYAEDYYIEKWSKFLLSEVTLELHSRTPYENSRAIRETKKKVQMNKKDFVAFEIDSIPERLPFLLSRDFVFVRPHGKNKLFKGIIFRVVKRVVLVEFEDDFHSQHTSTMKYDVSFSFNRVCLKRAHRAVSAAKDTSFHDILFPERRFTSSFPFLSPSNRILNHEGPSPYLLEGPLSTSLSGQLSVIGSLIQDATLKIYQNVPHCRILICAPRNQTCDSLMRNLQTVIPRSKLFRANAAFRDYDLVPDDIIPACLYEGECFTCPPLNELQEFKVVTSTFMSSFRLHNAGISAEHFTHIFLVDASSATEPETIVALADLVSKKTVIVVTGSSADIPRYIRSDIAQMHGLRKSYFKRLLESEPYSTRDPKFITHLKGSQ